MHAALLHPRWVRPIGYAALTVILLWTLHGAFSRPLRKPGFWPPGDYFILYHASRQVIERGRYDADLLFPYPPSAVALLATTIGPRIEYAAGVWMALCVAATLGTIVLGSSLVGLKHHPWRWPLALAAFALGAHFVIWDLRAGNSNMIYCFLLVAALAALEKQRDLLAGLCLAASIALKLYPALVMIYFAWTGRWRAFLATAACLAAFFAVLPAVVFGPQNLVAIHLSWLEHLRLVAARIDGMDHSILISLSHTLRVQLGADTAMVPWLVRGLSLVWLAAIAACLWSGRWRRTWPPRGWDLAVDGGLLALATVVISPYLEPYHPVVALLPLLALVARIIDSPTGNDRVVTSFTAAALVAGWLARTVSTDVGTGAHGLAGLGIYVQMLLVTIAVTMIRIHDNRQRRAPATAEDPLPLAA